MATIMDGTNPGTSLPEYGTADYWKKLQEAQAWAAQQAQQSAASTLPSVPTTLEKPSFWDRLTNYNHPNSAKRPFMNGIFDFWKRNEAPSGVSQAIGDNGYSNWNPQSQYPSTPMTAMPGYQNPYIGFQNNWERVMQENNQMNKYNTYTTYVKSNADLERQHPGWFDYLKPNVYGVLGNNAAVQKFNPSSPTFSPDTPFFTPQTPINFGFAPATLPDTPFDYGGGGGGYVAPTYNVNYGGGGGGGGRRSSSGVGRSKQLASWYQAMTNWNINRPQSG